MLKIKIIIPFAIAFFTAGMASSQTGLGSEEVDVIKNFDARLLDTERHLIKPELPALDTATQRQSYNIIHKTLLVDYLPPKIRPIAMRGDELPKGYKGYAKIGAGFPTAFFAEGSYDIFTKKKLDLGISLMHHSANNNKDVENQRFMYNTIGLDGTYYLDQGFAVNGNLNYTANDVYFYGYNDLNEEIGSSLSFDKEDVKQRISTFSGGGSIFNGERTEADFNYSAGFDFYILEDDFAARENNFNLNISATKWFSGAHPLRINLQTDFTTYKDTANQTLNNFYLQPSYTYHGDIFKVKIGANIASNEDEFSFFPDVELSANFIENILGAFVGAQGGLQKNSFKALSDYNPFIISRIKVKNTRFYHFYGGIKGNIQGIDYRAQISYKTAEDLALFLLNADSIPRFNVLYDTVDIVSLKASVTAPLFEGFELTGTVSQNFYSLDNEEKAWHLPSLSINVAAKYKTEDDKLLFRGEFFLENGVPFKNSEGKAENLNALFDISLGAEYFISEKVGVFISLNNLANNKRQRWHRYPVFGLNALAGITARF